MPGANRKRLSSTLKTGSPRRRNYTKRSPGRRSPIHSSYRYRLPRHHHKRRSRSPLKGSQCRRSINTRSRSPTRNRSSTLERKEEFLVRKKRGRRFRRQFNSSKRRRRSGSISRETIIKTDNKELYEKLALTVNGKWTASLENQWNLMEAEQIRYFKQFQDRQKQFQQKPEDHPRYADEWIKFWERRYQEIEKGGKDPDTYNYVDEWKVFWMQRGIFLLQAEVDMKIKEMKLKYGMDYESLRKIRFTQVIATPKKEVESFLPKNSTSKISQAAEHLSMSQKNEISGLIAKALVKDGKGTISDSALMQYLKMIFAPIIATIKEPTTESYHVSQEINRNRNVEGSRDSSALPFHSVSGTRRNKQQQSSIVSTSTNRLAILSLPNFGTRAATPRQSVPNLLQNVPNPFLSSGSSSRVSSQYYPYGGSRGFAGRRRPISPVSSGKSFSRRDYAGNPEPEDKVHAKTGKRDAEAAKDAFKKHKRKGRRYRKDKVNLDHLEPGETKSPSTDFSGIRLVSNTMSQFGFDGEFRRKPKQNLGGSSKISEQRDSVLQRAREDRERRQRERLIAKSIVVIQSCVRSFLIRARLKNLLRREFDNDEKSEYTYEIMMKQIKRFNLFYNPRIDADRLHDIARLLLSKSDLIVPKLHFDIEMQVRIRNIIVFCVRSYNVENPREAVLLRLVNVLTDVPSNQDTSIQWGISCWLHMIERADFFHEWRKFMERKIPPIDSPNHIPSTEFTTLCVSILKKPFAALLRIKNFSGMSSFGGEIMDTNTVYYRMLYKFTSSFCTNVIPSTRNSKMVAHVAFPSVSPVFPWMRWIKTLNTMLPTCNFTHDELRNILYAVLSLFNKTTSPPDSSDFDMSSFCDCLKFLVVSIDNRFSPIPNLPLHFYINFESDVYDELVKKAEMDAYYEDTEFVYQKLQDCLNCLEITNWIQPFNVERWVKLSPLLSCIIRLEPKYSSVQFKCLPQLAYNRNFIRSLFLRAISGGSRTDEEICTFCWFFCHLIETLHDAEFVDGIPLHAPELPALVNYAKTLYTTHVIEDKDSHDPLAMQSNKALVKMLRALHDRNTRLQMVNEEEFHSSIRLILPMDSHSIRFDENLSIPETRLPPLEMKLLRVLREFPFCLTFHDRVSIYNQMIAIDRGERFQGLGYPRENIQIRRKFIYEDAFDKLSPENVKNLRGLVRISLVNVVGALEAGVDGGGLLREFLIEATRAAVDPNRGLFRVDSQNRIYPNPVAKKIFPDYRNHFFLMGRLVGKALYEQTHLELPFAAFFIQTWITGKVASAVDYLATLDPAMHKNLLQLKEYRGDWNIMSIDFTLTMDELGETRVVELKKNGKDILVDSSNIIEYIHLVADYKINREMEEECRYFRAGICDVIPLLHIFSWREMQTLISGSDKPIDLSDWAANVNYSGGFAADHPTIVFFWEVLASFEEKDLRKLLKFVTSCSRPPLLGFKDLVPKFGIQNAGVTDRLPTASTCMNLLKLPELNTANDLREKLLYVIEAEAGFELS